MFELSLSGIMISTTLDAVGLRVAMSNVEAPFLF